MSTEPKHATAAPAVKSMTGYAQARAEHNGWAVRVSLRSVNHRFLDLHVRLPEGFEPFEPRIRQALRDRIRRGHVDVTLHCESAGPAAVRVNREVAAAYLEAARDLQKQFRLLNEPDMAAILRLPGVIDSAGPGEEEQERLAAAINSCLDDACARLEEMRQAEGRALVTDMSRRLKRIAQNAAKVEGLAAAIRPAYVQKLEARLRELLADTAVEPARLLQEAALVAERGDIAEEVARLKSHVRQFEELLSGAGEVGKKLDFLLQEMQREANTMLSKTPGVESQGLTITTLALEIKSEIEKLREQAQNVE